jgi:riboflavin transporter 2
VQVLAWVTVMFLLTFTKVSMAVALKAQGKRGLLWCGAFQQIGSLVGALIIFFIVNFFKLFKQAQLCV